MRVFFLVWMCMVLSVSHSTPCKRWSLLKNVCERFHQIVNDGNLDVYFSGYAWHNRFTYSPERVAKYNEAAWGGGLGKGIFDEQGHWRGLYAIAFLDSHRQLEPTVGYAYLKTWTFAPRINFKAGIGYSVMLTSRADIMNRVPFPGVLPWTSIFLGRASLAATYIPGSPNNGNVLFIVGKYALD